MSSTVSPLDIFPLKQRLDSPEPSHEPDDVRAGFLADKRRIQRDYIQRDAQGEDPESLGRWWSDQADRMLDEGLAAAWRQPDMKRRTTALQESGPVPGLFILGLGKLGGQDLNFSSDVDLVAFYEPDLVPVPPFEGKTDVCARALRNLNKLLDGSKTGPFAWRIDWRLRPDPSVTDLAMSTSAGLDYFFFHSPPWRRLAMMKARVVAGDKAAGQRFLAELHPFIWRRSLDKRAIDEINALHDKIHAEHPELKTERSKQVPLDVAAGFHTKLGRGGIREIEFLINAHQLVWGGRDPRLQTAHTLTALRVLVEEGLLAPELEPAYKRLRALENRVQLWADGHEHALPTTPHQQDWIAQRSGQRDWADLEAEVVAIRARVQAAFKGYFQDTESLTEAVETDIELLNNWQAGFQAYGLPQEAEPKFKALGREMAKLCLESADAKAASQATHAFLKSLGPSAASYLRLFAEQPRLTAHVIRPLMHSGAMAILLNQSPYVVDGLISNGGQVPSVPDLETGQALVSASANYERQLGALRAFVNEQLYMAFLAVFDEQRQTLWAQEFLTDLADMTLQLASDILCQEQGLDALPFSVLALGKLATRSMMPLSDLDLIFIVPNGTDFDQANKIARRFVALLDAPMKEGRAYPTDTRLRPSGRSGPPTVSLASFESYQAKQAHTWEHLALVTSRVVLDAPGIGPDIEAVRTAILTRPRDHKQLCQDAWKMLSRLRRARYQAEPGDGEVKLRPGGLMELEFLINFQVLALAASNPQILDVPLPQLASALDALLGAESKLAVDAKILQQAQFYARLYGEDWLKHRPIDGLAALFARILEEIDTQIAGPADLSPAQLPAFQETAVRWQGVGD